MTRLLTIAMMVAMSAIPAVAQFSDNNGNNSSASNEKSGSEYNWTPQGEARGAASEGYNGSNVGGPTWNRPIGVGPAISGLGPVVYHSEIFYVGTTGFYDIESVQDHDGYLHIYVGEFDPTDGNQLNNLIAANDDGAGGVGTSDIIGVELQANTVYYVITSGFDAASEGTFTNTISGAGPIVIGSAPVLVPTLGEWGLIAFVIMLAGAAVLYSRKNRMQTA